MRNDQVYAYKRGPIDGDPDYRDNGKEYEGWVVGIERDAIVVVFNPIIKNIANRGWCLRFAYHRYSKRIMHRAVDVFQETPALMALIRADRVENLPTDSKADFKANALNARGLNAQQKEFILNCLNRVTETAPLLA